MLETTSGLVLNFIRYKETSVISKIYTLRFGLQTYLRNSVRSSKGQGQIALFQPLSQVELVVYHTKNADIKRISSIRLQYAYQSIGVSIKKSAIGLFLAEVLNLVLKEEEESRPDLFSFLCSSLQILDYLSQESENFHLRFLLKLSKYLGFYPISAEVVYNQIYGNQQSSGSGAVSQDEFEALEFLITSGYEDALPINSTLRRNLLEVIIRFYGYYIENISNLRSVEVLKEVFE